MIDSTELLVYTDGACFPNPGHGGWGVVMIQPAGELRKLSGSAEQTTSNRMEMTAVLMALRELSSSGVPVVVRSDSELVIKTLLGKYGRHRNRELWTQIDRERSRLRLRSIRFEWVKGHAGERYNEMADRLANDAAGISESPPRPNSREPSDPSSGSDRRGDRRTQTRQGLHCNICRRPMRPIEPHDPSRATGQAWFRCDRCGQSGYKDRHGAHYLPALKLTAGESPKPGRYAITAPVDAPRPSSWQRKFRRPK